MGQNENIISLFFLKESKYKMPMFPNREPVLVSCLKASRSLSQNLGEDLFFACLVLVGIFCFETRCHELEPGPKFSL